MTVPLIARYVRQLVAADEGMIRDGVRQLAFEHGLVAEPSGATGVAAMSHGLVESRVARHVIVVSGRNVTRQLLVELLAGES